MPRACFSKTGRAVYISHLDLMRLFQRAFCRAGLPLAHGQGFHPRPLISIALPMSLGMESECELLDFRLEGENVPMEELRRRLNSALIEGVRVREVYEDGGKLKNLGYLECGLTLEYDRGIPAGAEEAIGTLLRQSSLTVTKKGKNGPAEQDIAPMLRELSLARQSDRELGLRATVCCQEPSLNPMLLEAAIRRYAPQYAPDHTRCRRLALYDRDRNPFR